MDLICISDEDPSSDHIYDEDPPLDLIPNGDLPLDHAHIRGKQ